MTDLPATPVLAEPGPVTAAERIGSIDVLRGVAVLGILIMNIQAFAMVGSAYMNPTSFGDFEGVNWWAWYVPHLLADMKFWTIFSMLFGAGIVIMTSRCEQTGRSAAGVHYRRMAWLLLFGLLHAHLIWYGDILYTYAMCGFVAYLFRRLPPPVLIGLGLAALVAAFGVQFAFGWMLAEGDSPPEFFGEAWMPPAEIRQAEIEAYRGSWLAQMSHRVPTSLFFETFLFAFAGMGARTGGLILIGMALYKLGVFSAVRSRAFYAGLVAAGLFVGVPVVMYGAHRNAEAGWAVEYSFFFGPLYNYWASLLVAMGWVGAVMLVWKAAVLRPLTWPLGAAGRMALSNYLLQSIICTTIFYGHGFGLFASLERWQLLLVVGGVWVFELVLSPIWLRYFRFGPFEWLWRSLTYLRPQPMVRREA